MNWLLILVLAIVILFTLHGYHKGFIRVFFSLFSIILTIILVSSITPVVKQFLKEETPLYTTLKEKYIEKMESNEEDEETGAGEQEMEYYGVPGILVHSLLQENSNNIEELKSQGQNVIYEYIGGYIAELTISLISFVVVFLAVTIFLRLTIFTLDIIANLPILKGFNKFAGLFAGFTEGVIIVWIIFLVITMFIGSEIGTKLGELIYQSRLLTYIYNNNYLLKMI